MADEKIVKMVQKALDDAPERKFKESVDIAINLKDVDLSVPKNRIAEEIILPKGRGKDLKIAVIGSAEMLLKAKVVADVVINEEELDTYAEDKKKGRHVANDFDFFIAEAPLMPAIGKKMGIFLGPRGKMPRPMPPGADPSQLVANLRNSVRVRSKDKGTFHVAVGTTAMSAEDLSENIEAILKRLLNKLERGKQNIDSIYVKTTMGPSVRLM